MSSLMYFLSYASTHRLPIKFSVVPFNRILEPSLVIICDYLLSSVCIASAKFNGIFTDAKMLDRVDMKSIGAS